MVRMKYRYLTVRIESTQKSAKANLFIGSRTIRKSIEEALQKLHGDFGLAVVGSNIIVKYCNKETRVAIIRCGHGPHLLLASVLPFVDTINNYKVQVHLLYTGATLSHCYKFIRKYQLNYLRKVSSTLTNAYKQTDAYVNLKKKVMHLEKMVFRKKDVKKNKEEQEILLN